MGKARVLVVALVSALLVCTTQGAQAAEPAVSSEAASGMQWEQWAMGEVAAGRMPHSAYYRGLSERLMKMPETEGRDVMVMLMNEAEIESMKFEHGEISRAELSSYLNQIAFLMGQVGKEAQRRP